MIKEVKEIPTNKKRDSKRDLIRADINEAIEKGINKFEFIGDYNYKYLRNYAKEEADRIVAKMIWTKQRELLKELLKGNETNEKGFHVFLKGRWEYRGKFIKITTCKGEEHRRVFGEINFNDFDSSIREDVVNEIEKARENYQWDSNMGKWINKRRRG